MRTMTKSPVALAKQAVRTAKAAPPDYSPVSLFTSRLHPGSTVRHPRPATVPQNRLSRHHPNAQGFLRPAQSLVPKEVAPLPYAPFEACRTQPSRVNSELLVRFDDNDYSVPMEYAYQDVVVKGYTDLVRICRFGEVIAEHPRCWGREHQIFNTLHYLPLLERKPHSLALPGLLRGWSCRDASRSCSVVWSSSKKMVGGNISRSCVFWSVTASKK